MIIVRANARNATYISDDLITSGSVGIPVTFNLSENFDGLSCIAVFEGSGVSIDVALMGNTCVVPHEVLATAGGYLRVGIYASNAEGTIVIPTVWAGSKMILQGTEPSELDPSEPTPSWAAQVQAAAAEAVQTSEEAIEIAGGAEAAAEEARQSASAAAASATEAGQSANAAGTAQAAAQAAAGAATSARDAAVAAQGSAESSAQTAAGSATAAAGSAAAAAASEAAAREVEESIPADYTALSEDVSELKSQTNTIQSNLAPAFSESTAYTAGQYVTYTDGKLYQFTTDHAAGAWNSAQVQVVTTGAKLSDLNSALSANDKKTNKFVISNNIVDPNGITDGYYIKYTDGTLASNASYAVTDYIMVFPGESYTQTVLVSGGQICFFDINKNYVSGLLLNSNTFTIPEGCYYLRDTLTIAEKSQFAICRGSQAVYTPYNEYVYLPDDTVHGDAIKDDSIDFDKIAFKVIQTGPNLFNKAKAVVGYVRYNTGGIATSYENYRASDFIPVEPNTTYTINVVVGGAQTAFYNENKTYISGVLVPDNGQQTSPETARYMRTTCSAATLDTFAVCKGNSASFTPYTEKQVINPQYIPKTESNDYFDIIVANDGTGDYTTLTEAVLHAEDGDSIYVKAGVYDNEEVEGWGKDITIIGEDMLNTVIKNGLNTYSRPPMELSAGRLSNMTVYAYDGGGASLDPNGWKAYSIHIDNNAQFENTLHIDNCILMSDTNSAVGIGLRKGELRFDNCKFVSRDSIPFYFHDTTNTAYGDGQYLTVKNCEGYAKNSTTVMRINSQKTVGSVVYPEFINNIFVSHDTDNPIINAENVDNTGGQATTVGTFMNLINFYQVKTSRNNYPAALDYQP